MRKAVCIILAAVVCLAGIICAANHLKNRAKIKEMLSSVSVSDDIKTKMLAYDYWKDPLWYVNGYEVIALRIDPEKWTTPEGWYKKQVNIDEIEPIIEFEICESAITDLKADLPEHFDEYYFAESGREGEFSNWEFYIGLYSSEGLLVVYRGHDLNSDIWRLLDDAEVTPWTD